jgi:hypothetical protein
VNNPILPALRCCLHKRFQAGFNKNHFKKSTMKKNFLQAVILFSATIITTNAAAQSGAEGLKTRTKSNQANERTAAESNENTTVKLTAPATGKAFTADEAKKAIAFRWTPIVPKPQTVTYRLKVWQLMQGQNGSQAMRTNKPIVEKEMMRTEAAIMDIYTGPCKPPYLCNYIWTVEAIDADGKPISEKTTTEAFTFSIVSAEKNDY